MTNEFFTDIFEAITLGTLNDVKSFVEEKGADVNAKSDVGWLPFRDSGRTTLHRAIHKGNLEIIKYLLSKGADINERDDDGETVLCRAAWFNRADLVEFFVLQGVDVNEGIVNFV